MQGASVASPQAGAGRPAEKGGDMDGSPIVIILPPDFC